MSDKLQRGYALLSRDTLDSSLWMLPPGHFRVAAYLILRARHSSRKHSLPDGTTVSRGELVTSMSLIAENCAYYENRSMREYSRKKILNILSDLDGIGFLKRNSHRKGTHISICNYDIYQRPDSYNSHKEETNGEHRGNTDGTLGEQSGYTNKKGNKAKKGIKEEGESFPALIAKIDCENPSIADAIAAVYASNDSFASVQGFHVANSLQAQPDRSKWYEAISGMSAKFAGVEMDNPNQTLKNWMVGKRETKINWSNV